MDIPSWSFTNIGQSMMQIKPKHIKENEELLTKTQTILIKESVKLENLPETTNFDKIKEFLYTYVDLGFDMNFELFIDLYI